ncbi:TolC family protein [Mesonia aquimarina]|uniref:TolC family protein n=1 Tax=Mesonia aquimarina TaxID=1504967 RepID=UPI000EF58188|nr:TolC family protein [Mesonia aquimarina]
MKKINQFLLAIILLAGFVVQAQEQVPFLSKKEAIEQTLENNFGIEIAENNTEIAENNAGVLNSGYLPSLVGNAFADYSLNDRLTEVNGEEPRDQNDLENTGYGGSIALNYTLFDGLGRLYNYRQLKEQYNLSELEARETIENTMLELFSVYFEIARLSENVEVLKQTLAISRQRVTRAEYQFDYGQSNKLEVLNAKVDVTNDSINLISTKQQLRNTKRDLSVILNREPSAQFEVDTLVSFTPEITIENYVEKAKENNVSLLQIEQNLVISEYDVKVNKSGYLPTVGLTGSYGWNRNRSAESPFFPGSLQTTSGLSASVNLSWDLFDGGSTSVRVRNAKIRYENQQLQKEQIENEVHRDLKNALDSYQNRLYIYRLQEQNVITSQANFERSEERFKIGQISSIEFRQAQINLINAKTSKNLAKYDAKLAELQVLQLSGQLLNVEF